jgi:hypothetical protein
VQPYLPDETFILRTPSDDNLVAKYPGTSYIRVTSYVDATAITPLGGGVLVAPGIPDQSANGQTLYYRSSQRIESPGSGATITFLDWDTWVAQRIAHRSAAMKTVMKEAHLTSPLPGLAEMDGQGDFFDCAPYGTCWEPTAAEKLDPEGGAEIPADSPSAKPALATALLDQHRSAAKLERVSMGATGAQAAPDDSQTPAAILQREEFFPCTPASVRLTMERDPATGRLTIIDAEAHAGSLPYAWGVCHAGYWIHRRHHYAWVVGKRHHHEPIRWIRSGRTVAYVPLHPHDLTGKVPINAKYDVFAVSRKDGVSSVERITLGPEHSVELLASPPKEFRTVYLRPLARAEEPKMEARTIKDAMAGKTAGAGVPITFDRKSQSFTMPVHIMEGNRMVTVSRPIVAHSAGAGGSSGERSGGSSGSRGSGSGSGSHSSASSGGGSHSSAGGSSAGSSGGSSGGSHH